MSIRRNGGTSKKDPVVINGWILEKCPNTFAETYVYEIFNCDSEGFVIQRVGFQNKRDAIKYAETNDL